MACVHPLKRFTIGIKPNGKTIGKVTSLDVDYLWRCADGSLRTVLGNSSDKDNFRNSSFYKKYSDKIILGDYITCGKCMPCRLRKAREWSVRCVLEQQYHDESCFITLTYNDEHLPPKLHTAANPETGEFNSESIINSLDKSHLRDFNKRLRRHCDYHENKKLRFFGCGEYGSKNMRPHYHEIVFGWRPKDLQFYRKNELGQTLYTSPMLEKIWGKGFVTIGEATYESMGYVARYITKKLLGQSSFAYEFFGYVPEYNLYPNRPGLAKQYFLEHSDEMYKTDELIINRGIDKALRCKPPRYFDNLFDVDHHEELEEIKEKRKRITQLNREKTMDYTGLTLAEILENESVNLEHKYSQLVRPL